MVKQTLPTKNKNSAATYQTELSQLVSSSLPMLVSEQEEFNWINRISVFLVSEDSMEGYDIALALASTSRLVPTGW